MIFKQQTFSIFQVYLICVRHLNTSQNEDTHLTNKKLSAKI